MAISAKEHALCTECIEHQSRGLRQATVKLEELIFVSNTREKNQCIQLKKMKVLDSNSKISDIHMPLTL